MYLTQSTIANDPSLTERIRSCYAQETRTDPVTWVYNNRYVWAASPEWDVKWEYAVNSDNNNPGADNTVITDGDILATVQQLILTQTPPAPPLE
jgi:hypothetical protein